jgi:hypothetical protein
MMAFLPNIKDTQHLFKTYLDGLALIAKSDLFYKLDKLARASFATSLSSALQQFSSWDGKAENFETVFHTAFTPLIPELIRRTQMLKVLTVGGDSTESSLNNLRDAKRLLDIYLIHIAISTWRKILVIKK